MTLPLFHIDLFIQRANADRKFKNAVFQFKTSISFFTSQNFVSDCVLVLLFRPFLVVGGACSRRVVYKCPVVGDRCETNKVEGGWCQFQPEYAMPAVLMPMSVPMSTQATQLP